MFAYILRVFTVPEAKIIALSGESNETSVSLKQSSKTTVHSLICNAELSCRKCPCEGREEMAHAIVTCSDCHHTSCVKCSGRPEHSYDQPAGRDKTLAPRQFLHEHKASIPTRVCLTGLKQKKLKAISPSESEKMDKFVASLAALNGVEFRFRSWTRGASWTALFCATNNATLELILGKADPKWLLYLPHLSGAARSPAARMALSPASESILSGSWEISFPHSLTFDVTIKGGTDLVPTFEASIGLPEPYEDTKRCKDWTITLDSSDEYGISGTYTLLEKCGGPMGTLHKRIGGGPEMFFFLEESRSKPKEHDRFVFSPTYRRLTCTEQRGEVASLDANWRTSDSTDEEIVSCTVPEKWVKAKFAALNISGKTTIDVRVPTLPPAVEIRIKEDEACCSAIEIVRSSFSLSSGDTIGIKEGVSPNQHILTS